MRTPTVKCFTKWKKSQIKEARLELLEFKEPVLTLLIDM